MIAGTHVAFASALYLGGAGLFEYETSMICWALAAAASLLPGIDLPTSRFGRVLFWISTRLEREFGHRTLTHSLLVLVVVAMLAGPLYLVNPAWFGAIVGSYWYTLRLEAIDNLTLAHVKCDCPVVGTWKGGPIVLQGGKPRAVGPSQERHNLYPTHTELTKGELLRVVAQRVEMRGRTLGWLLERLDKRHTYYISGQMVVGRKSAPVEDIDLYRPVSLSGKALKLHYAREQELGPYLGMVAAEGEVYVQFWLRPGDEVVGGAGEREMVPDELAGYL